MAKAYKGLPMEGVIATWYAKNTAADLARFTQTALMLSERLRPGGDVLEVAPGPGYLAIELAKRGYSVTALDISKSFVEIARGNADTYLTRWTFQLLLLKRAYTRAQLQDIVAQTASVEATSPLTESVSSCD